MACAPRSLLAVLAMLALTWCTPTATAADDGPDIHATLQSTGPPLVDAPPGWFTFTESQHGQRYAFAVEIPVDYAVAELRIPRGLFDIERDRQVVPWFNVSDTHDPLFDPFPRADLWNIDAPAQVFAHVEHDDLIVLRLGFVGPVTGTFDLHRDVTAPTFDLGPVGQVNHRGFYQETTSNEPTIANLRWWPSDSDTGPVENPTPQYHVKHRFPIQGMDPATTYDANITFTDWAGNMNASATYQVTTTSVPDLPPIVEAIAPTPDTTLDDGDQVGVAVRVTGDDGPVELEKLRLFVDLEEHEVLFHGGDAPGIWHTTVPVALTEGTHVLNVEAQTMAGQTAYQRWVVHVGQPGLDAEAPVGWLVSMVVVGTAVAVCRRSRA